MCYYCGLGFDIVRHTCKQVVNDIGGCAFPKPIISYPYTIRKIAEYRKRNSQLIGWGGESYLDPCKKCDLGTICKTGFPKKKWFSKDIWDKDYMELY